MQVGFSGVLLVSRSPGAALELGETHSYCRARGASLVSEEAVAAGRSLCSRPVGSTSWGEVSGPAVSTSSGNLLERQILGSVVCVITASRSVGGPGRLGIVTRSPADPILPRVGRVVAW